MIKLCEIDGKPVELIMYGPAAHMRRSPASPWSLKSMLSCVADKEECLLQYLKGACGYFKNLPEGCSEVFFRADCVMLGVMLSWNTHKHAPSEFPMEKIQEYIENALRLQAER